jgi:hypothetical protein
LTLEAEAGAKHIFLLERLNTVITCSSIRTCMNDGRVKLLALHIEEIDYVLAVF